MDKIEKIDYMLDHFFVKDEETKHIIADVLLRMPEHILEYVVKNVLFYPSEPDRNEDGVCINMTDLECYDKRKNFIIILDSNFFRQSEEGKYYTIAHEIGHAYLNHENASTNKDNENQADNFASQYGFKKPADRISIN